MARLSNIAAWLLSGTVLMVVVAWTNLTGLGLGTQPLTYDDVALPRFIAALVGVAAVWLVLALMLSRGNTLLSNPTWWLLGALAVWAAVSAAVANTSLVWLGQSERLEGVATVVLYAVLFGAGLQLGRSKRFIRRFSGTLVLGAVLLAVQGLLQVAKLDPTNYTVSGAAFYLGSAFASLGNPNFLAGVLVLALPVAVGLALTSGHDYIRILWWGSAAVVLGALYATYSQGAWLAVVIELALAAGVWAWSRQAGTREAADDSAGDTVRESRRSLLRVATIVVGIVVVGVVVIVGVTSLATSAGLRLWGSSLAETGSGRVLLIQATVNAVAERPLFGYGPDNYLAAFRLNRPDRWVEVFGALSTNANAHSWLLQFAATLGIPGALLLGLALGFGIVRSRPRSAVRRDDPACLLAAAIWVGVIGYAVQMMLNVAVLASTVPFWVLLGAISASCARRSVVSRTTGLAAAAVCAVLLVGAVIGSGMLFSADRAYIASRLAYNGEAAGNPVVLAEKAATLNPLSVKYSRAVAQSRSKLVLDAIAQNAPKSDVRVLYADAAAAFGRTLSLSPNDYAALSWLAGLQAATGAHLQNPALLTASQETARKAAALDLTHWSVAPLLEGEISSGAIRLAVSEPGLP